MERITSGHPNSGSADLVQENIEQLKQLFPEVIKEGKVDFEALHDLLGNYGDTAEERFCLNWAGKANARREAQKRSTGTLRPCPEESVDWDNTENLYIEGDNLEVLKLLQKSYHGKVKMIYIDPPYNTGKDFVYKDNYVDNMANYLEMTGQDKKFSTNTDTDGRYHSNWLNMMYPRLKLARNLLKEDGVIFISIDDSESVNLKKICDEVFGEENFIANIAHKARASVSNDKIISSNHNYILLYAKEQSVIHKLRHEFGIEDDLQGYDNLDEKGEFKYVPVDGPGGALKGNPYYDFEGVEGYFRFSKEKMSKLYKAGLVVKVGNGLQQKKYKHDALGNRKTITTWWDEKLYTSTATRKLKDLMGGDYFNNPKPVPLIMKMLDLWCRNDSDIILDFFSGSGTTAHAVMEMNKNDNIKRRYICVQLQEKTLDGCDAQKAGYNTISEIGKERIRLAGQNLLAEIEEANDEKLDLGFKVFKLDSSNLNSWDTNPDNLEAAIQSALFNIKEDRSEDDLLYEILLKYGIDLTVKVNRHNIAGKTVFEMGAGSLIICLADQLSIDVAEGIGKLWQEVRPDSDAVECRVVFKDDGFNSKDDLKANTVLTLKQYGIENVATI